MEAGQQGGWALTIISAIIFVYSYFFLFYVADYLDNGMKPSLKTFPYMIGSFLSNIVLATVAQLEGIVKYKNQNTWVKTEHFITSDVEGETHAGYESLTKGEVPGIPEDNSRIRKVSEDTRETA